MQIGRGVWCSSAAGSCFNVSVSMTMIREVCVQKSPLAEHSKNLNLMLKLAKTVFADEAVLAIAQMVEASNVLLQQAAVFHHGESKLRGLGDRACW